MKCTRLDHIRDDEIKQYFILQPMTQVSQSTKKDEKRRAKTTQLLH